MRKAILFFLLIIFSVETRPASLPATVIIKDAISLNDPVNPYHHLSTLKIKDAEKLLGRKMKLKEKLAFKVFQWKIKKGYQPINKAQEKNSKGNTAMILGIIGIAALFIPYVNIAAIPCAILAIVLGNQAKKINPNDGQAKAGVILGWVSIGVFILALIVVIAWLSSGGFFIFG